MRMLLLVLLTPILLTAGCASYPDFSDHNEVDVSTQIDRFYDRKMSGEKSQDQIVRLDQQIITLKSFTHVDEKEAADTLTSIERAKVSKQRAELSYQDSLVDTTDIAFSLTKEYQKNNKKIEEIFKSNIEIAESKNFSRKANLTQALLITIKRAAREKDDKSMRNFLTEKINGYWHRNRSKK